jgi:hypothetical protein
MVFLSMPFISQSIYHSSQQIVKGFCKKEVWPHYKESSGSPCGVDSLRGKI